MIIYKNNSTDPYFNLAAEQYLLDTKPSNCFMLWRNESSVIIGKNQNAYAELDMNYIEKENIKVVRRLTGGGAVFHDTGNVNFSFIVPKDANATLDFKRFTTPVIAALSSLGIDNVCLSGRNDILINGTKISGNAQSCYNEKTLHHGTLLYSSDLSKLEGALRVDPEKIRSKGIKSVRNRVTNISGFLKDPPDTLSFMDYLEKYIAKETNGRIVDLTDEDVRNIQKLAEEKYSTWEWNFGRSKEYAAEKKKRYPFGGVSVDLSVENGFIKHAHFYGDFFGTKDVSLLEDLLVGTRYTKEDIENNIDHKLVFDCIAGMTVPELAELLLS